MFCRNQLLPALAVFGCLFATLSSALPLLGIAEKDGLYGMNGPVMYAIPVFHEVVLPETVVLADQVQEEAPVGCGQVPEMVEESLQIAEDLMNDAPMNAQIDSTKVEPSSVVSLCM